MKIINRLFLLTFLALAFVAQSFAQAAGTASLTDQAALVTEMDVNGLKVLIKRRPNSPTIAAGLFIRGGAKTLTAQNAGIGSFMLNAATEGSQKFPREALRRELARTATSIGSGVTYDYSVLQLAATREHFDRAWDIFTDIALNPAFAPEDVELTREKLLTSLRDDADDPDNYLQILQERTVYANHPYANSPRGTIENVSRFKIEDLRAFHRSQMETSRLLLVIVGDLDANALRARINESFGKLPRGAYKEQPTTSIAFTQPTVDVTERTLPTNYVQGVFASPSLADPDFYAMQVATTLLSDRVVEEVRNKRNLSYAPSAGMGSLVANTGNIYVTAVDANQAVSVMLDEIKNMQTASVDEREISGVAGQFLTRYFIGQETNAAQAGELARYELTGGGWRNAFESLNRVRAVTPEDVRRVSQKYMRNLRFVVLGNPQSINREIFLRRTE